MANIKPMLFLAITCLLLVLTATEAQASKMNSAKKPTVNEAQNFCSKKRLKISGKKETYEECLLRLQSL